MTSDSSVPHHFSDKEEKYIHQFDKYIIPFADAVEVTLEKLANPAGYRRLSKPISEVPELFVPDVLSQAFYMVFVAMKDDAKMGGHLTAAILCRSLIECMGNVHWLASSHNGQELKHRSTLLFNQAENIYKYTSGKLDRIPSLSYLGAGSIISRIKACGDGWPGIYSHLSSYCHMDAGFAIHYHLQETLGMRNLCVFFACSAAQQLISDEVELQSSMPRRFRKDIKKDLVKLEELHQSFLKQRKLSEQ